MRPLRFCMITTFYPPYSFGGDGIAVFSMANSLARRGHQVDVIFDVDAFSLLGPNGPDGPAASNSNEPGVRLHPLKSWAGPLSPLATQQTGRPLFKRRKIEAILNDVKPDVIHYHNVSLVGGPGLFFLGDAVKLYSIHEHWLVCPMHVLWKFDREVCNDRSCLACQLHGMRPPQLWRSTGLMQRALREIDLFLCASEFAARRHTDWGGLTLPVEHFVFHSMPASPADESNSSDSIDAKPVNDRPYFLMVGRHEKIKGFQNVIPLFERSGDVDLWITGRGRYTTELEELSNGNDRVRLIGHVDEDKLTRCYRDAVALIVPSICFEVFPLVLLEAFASKTPVIVHDIGPLREIVEKSGGGLVYNTDEELIEATNSLENDPPKRNQLAEQGHRYYQENWTEEVGVQRYLEIVKPRLEIAERKG